MGPLSMKGPLGCHTKELSLWRGGAEDVPVFHGDAGRCWSAVGGAAPVWCAGFHDHGLEGPTGRGLEMKGLTRDAPVRDPLKRARTLVGQHGGEWVDPWSLGDRVLVVSDERGLSLERASRDVVSEALWARAMKGEHGPRRRLLTLWHREVHRWCRSVAGRLLEPDGLTREVLVRALGRLESNPRRLGWGAWLLSTLLRVVREREARARMARFVPGLLSGQEPHCLPLVDAAMVARARVPRVQLALGLLAGEARVLLWAHDVEGLRPRDIGRWTGLGEGAVRRRLRRARAAFERNCSRLGLAP